jgi:hypothetical protein
MQRAQDRRPKPGAIADPVAAGVAADAAVLDPLASSSLEPVDPGPVDADPSTAPSIAAADEPLHVPGLLASVRRHPRLVRASALTSIAAGVVVFAVAGATLPLAGADSAPAQPKAVASYVPVPVSQIPPPLGPLLPAAGNGKAATAPRKAPAPAPSDPAAISGLAANGIPSVALNAYRVAAARMDNVDPGCHIGWWLIAGIGRVESDHGRFGGAVLHADGISTPRIIGPALDGKHWDYIPAPGNGLQLDGDAKYAHALGPMQFIPSTWAIYGADANGDGVADIFNINDAALGTARYLCAAGGDLSTLSGQTRAVLTYNHSSQYLAEVLALADAYRRGLRVTGIPIVGITKGGLPTVVDTGYVPPANPGAPTAVGGTSKSTAKKGGTSSPSKSPSKSPSTSSSPSTGGSSTGTRTPTSTAPSPTSSRTTSAPAPSGSSSPTPSPSKSTTTPTPSPSQSCSPLAHMLGWC